MTKPHKTTDHHRAPRDIPALSAAEHREAAAALLDAEATQVQIGLLTDRFPQMTMADAYAVQNALLAEKTRQGRRVIGWKIGLTSRAMQDALQIDIPDSGILFDDMDFASGAVVPPARFIQPRIEAEIAFIMGSALGGAEVTRADVVAATASVAPSIEILDTRIQRRDAVSGRPRTVLDTISDNAANGGVVLGHERHGLDRFDLAWVGAITARDGVIEETGLGAGVLGDPVESVAWLARRMAQYGQRIEPGQIVLSGSFIRPIECPPGSHIVADFGDFGRVEIGFA